jgi:hypothetical protein
LKRIFISFLLGLALLLSGCGGTLSVEFDQTATPEIAMYATAQARQEKIATLAPQAARSSALLDTSTDSETIRLAMLESHNKWRSIWVTAVIVDRSPNGAIQSTQVQMWVERLTGRFRVLSGPLESVPDTLQVSDGTNQARVNLVVGSRQEQPLLEAAHNIGWQPPMTVSDTIESHPLDMEIDSRLSEMIFPQALAERGGSYTPSGVEDVADERSLMVSWSLDNQVRDRFWIDAANGIILRRDTWGKDSTEGAPESTIVVRRLVFNVQVPDSMFALNLAERPEFLADPSGYLVSTPLPEALQLDPSVDALYFTVAHGQDPLQLVRLPGSCVTGPEPCPVPEVLPTSPVMQGEIHPLIWSPDRSLAALNFNGAIYTYSPSSGVWNSVALFPIITGEPAWAPDGEWIVFSIMNEAGKDLYAVRSNGTDLHNLTNGQINQVETLWIDGFLAQDRLVFSTLLGTTSETYTLDLLNSQAEKIAGLSTHHGILATAPDGFLAAYSDQQDGAASLNLVVMENGQKKEEPRRLTTLNQASIQQVLFAPSRADRLEDTWIAFLVASGANDPGAVGTVTLYAIRADGTDIRQLYQDDSILRVTFAADGQHLIAEGGAAGRLVILSLDGEKKVLDAPGLRPDQQLLGASWK